MAVQNVQVITDDFGGKGEATPVNLTVDGQSFRIDLNKTNHRHLMQRLAKYMQPEFAAPPRPKSVTPRKSTKSNASKVREWARENGIQVGERGRIPASVHAAYAYAVATA